MVDEKERAQSISETMTDGLLELDLQGKIIQANPAALALLGFTREEIIQKTHRDLTPDKWQPQESQTIQEVTLVQGKSIIIEQEYLRKDGSLFPVALKPILLADADKKPTKIIILFQNLTGQKDKEQLQRSHLRRLNSLSLITRKLQENDTVDQTIHFVLEALVAAMKYPEVAVPLIAIEDETFSTNKYSDELDYGLTASLFVHGRETGEVTVYYSENKPFALPDEQYILETVAQSLGVWLAQKSAAQELADFEAQYRSIFDTMADGFALYEVKDEGRELIVMDWNRAAEKMYNLLQHDVLGQDIKKFFPAMQKTDVYKAILECSRSGETKTIPLVHYQDVQRDQYLHTIIYQVGDKVATIFRDVTEEEKIRQELMLSEQKFRSLIEGSAEAVYLYTQDPGSPKFIEINQQACQMLRYTREELLVLGPTRIGSPVALERMEELRSEGSLLFESEHMTKEGTLIPVEINSSFVELGGQKYILSFVRDISERKQLEKVLRESEERFRNLSEVAPTGIFFLNMRGEVIYVNKKFILLSEMSFDECLGDGWRKLIHPEEQEQVLKLIAGTLLQGKEFSLKFRIVNRRNETRWAHFQIKMMGSPKNQPAGFIGIVEDVTDLEKAKTELTNQLAFIQQLLEDIPLPVFYKDTKGIYLGCNQAFEHFLGQSKEMIVGKSVYELSPKDLADVYHQKEQELFNHPGMQIYESSIQQSDGARRAVIFNKATYNNPDGTVAGLIGVIVDVTERKQLEVKLLKQREELLTIIDASPAMIFYKDRENRFIMVNKALAKATGRTKEEMEGKSLFDLYPKEDAGKYWRDDKEVMDSGQPKLNIVESMETKEGVKWIQTDKVLYRNEKEEVVGVIGFALDITGRKKAEETLAVSEQKYQTMIETSNDLIWALDNEGKFTYFNGKAEEVSGYILKDWLGRSFAPLIPPEDLETLQHILQEVLSGQTVHYETRVKKKDNTFFVLSVNTTPLYSAEGKITGTISFGQDITEYKKAEDTLKEAKESIERIINSVQDVFCVFDLQGRFIYWNKALGRVTGYSDEEIASMPLLEFFSREDSWQVKEFMDKVAKEGSARLEVNVVNKDVRQIAYEFTGSLLKDSQGNSIGISGNGRDLTDRQRMEKELQKRINELERFNKVTMEREKRVIELKKKVKELEQDSHGQT